MAKEYQDIDDLLDDLAKQVISNKTRAKIEIEVTNNVRSRTPEGGVTFNLEYHAFFHPYNKEPDLKYINENITIDRTESVDDRVKEEFDYITKYVEGKGLPTHVNEGHIYISRKIVDGKQLNLF